VKRTVMPQRTKGLARAALKRDRNSLAQLRNMAASGGGTAAMRPRPRDTGPDRKTRELVLKRDGYACVCCGHSVIGQRYSLQHRQRRSQGGSNLPSNLLTVLGDGTTGCHARIDSRMDPHDEARGYTVRSRKDPALVSVMVFSEGGSGVRAWPTDAGEWVFEPPAGDAA
jgi:hypothetical protein